MGNICLIHGYTKDFLYIVPKKKFTDNKDKYIEIQKHYAQARVLQLFKYYSIFIYLCCVTLYYTNIL